MAVRESQRSTTVIPEGEVVAGGIHERVEKQGLDETMAERFDRTFVWDLIVGLGLFLTAVICVLDRVPLAGHPYSLLVGPFVGLLLTLIHTPPR